MSSQMKVNSVKQNYKKMDYTKNLQNAVLLGAAYPSTPEKLVQEWAPTLENQDHEIKEIESFDTKTNIVQTFEIPSTSQLRYGGDLELKIGNKIEGFLELLQKGVVFGDGDYSEMHEICGNSELLELLLEQPDKLYQLHHDFLEAGSDVLRALTFCPSMAGNADNYKVKKLNDIACQTVCKLASEKDALVAGVLCSSADYMNGRDKEYVQTHFKQQIESVHNCKVDLFLCDMFAVEEAEWAIEVLKDSSVPIAVTLCVDKLGTVSGTSLGDCAIKTVKAGADVVGVCCKFDGESPEIITSYVEIMRAALDREGLQQYIMTSPHASSLPSNQHQSHHHTNQSSQTKSLEQSVMNTHARALSKAGVRFFRAGCGLGIRYIHHLSTELFEERAKSPISIKPFGLDTMDKYQSITKGNKQYVMSPSCCKTFDIPAPGSA